MEFKLDYRILPPSWISETKQNQQSKGTGRKKIDIKKIEKNSSRKVTFSKRRMGIFKKADELCQLCNAEIAIIVFSPKGRLYTYGHPSPDHVIDMFLSENNHDKECGEGLTREDKSLEEMHEDKECVKELTMEDESSQEEEEEEEGFLSENRDDKEGGESLTGEDKSLEGMHELHEDKECVKELTMEVESSEEMHEEEEEEEDEEEGFWWEKSIEDLNGEELERYKSSLEVLRDNVAIKMEEMAMRRTCVRDLLSGSKENL